MGSNSWGWGGGARAALLFGVGGRATGEGEGMDGRGHKGVVLVGSAWRGAGVCFREVNHAHARLPQ